MFIIAIYTKLFTGSKNDDETENEFSVEEGFRILSAYKTAKDVKQ